MFRRTVHHRIKLSPFVIQFLRRPHFQDLALREDDYFIKISDGLKPVSDGNDGRVLELFPNEFLHQFVGLEVDVGGGFVQNEVLFVLEHGPSQAKQLLFAHTEAAENLVEFGVESDLQLSKQSLTFCNFSQMFTETRASIICSSLLSLNGSMFLRRVSENRNGVCGMHANFDLSSPIGIFRALAPSKV
jgi:hypothetical protein